MTNERKKLTFWFAMLSLFGILFSLYWYWTGGACWDFMWCKRGGYWVDTIDEYGFAREQLIGYTIVFSLPLIIQIIYNIIFREEKNDKSGG